MTEQLHFHFSLSCIGEGNGNPLQCFCLENPRDGGAWLATVYGVAQSRTRLKWLSSSSSRALEPKEQPERWCGLSILNKRKSSIRKTITHLKRYLWVSYEEWIKRAMKTGRPIKRLFYWPRTGWSLDKCGESGNRVEKRSWWFWRWNRIHCRLQSISYIGKRL